MVLQGDRGPLVSHSPSGFVHPQMLRGVGGESVSPCVFPEFDFRLLRQFPREVPPVAFAVLRDESVGRTDLQPFDRVRLQGNPEAGAFVLAEPRLGLGVLPFQVEILPCHLAGRGEAYSAKKGQRHHPEKLSILLRPGAFDDSADLLDRVHPDVSDPASALVDLVGPVDLDQFLLHPVVQHAPQLGQQVVVSGVAFVRTYRVQCLPYRTEVDPLHDFLAVKG